MQLDEILKLAVSKHASDVHLKAGIMPVIRKHGVLRPLATDLPPLSPDEIHKMAMGIMDDQQRAHFLDRKEIDLGYGISGLGRFRVNVFFQRGTVRMVIRNIPHHVPTFKDLNLPSVLEKIADYERGLVLVTGVTGAGKSSTLAAIVDQINRHKNKHILTLEDPIEFLIRDRKSVITQRELGVDVLNFANSLRAALRQDPDVILIGEMRDRETIEIALLAAETGHLVLSTLHTMDAKESVNRVVAAFPPHQQRQIRLQLAAVLKAVVSQRLARRKDKKGFVPAVEVLINNARVREMIEDPDKTRNIPVALEEGKVGFGMQSFDQSLMELIAKDLIDYETALKLSSTPEDFAMRYSGVTGGTENEKTWAKAKNFKKRNEEEWQNLSEVEIEVPDDDKES